MTVRTALQRRYKSLSTESSGERTARVDEVGTGVGEGDEAEAIEMAVVRPD